MIQSRFVGRVRSFAALMALLGGATLASSEARAQAPAPTARPVYTVPAARPTATRYYYYPSTTPRYYGAATAPAVRTYPLGTVYNSRPYDPDWSTARGLPLAKPWMRPLR